MKVHYKTFGLIALAMGLTPLAAKADVVINNSSFESPGVGNSMSPTGGGFEQGYLVGGAFVDGWTFVNGGGVAHNGSAFGAPNAPDGVQVGVLQGGAPTSISQNLTGFTVGSSYVFNFYEAARNFGGGADPFTVSFNGALLGTFTPGSFDFTQVTTASFTAASSSGLLSFAGLGVAGQDVTSFIDDVTIAKTADAAPAPLAGAGLLSFFGAGGIALRKRVRRSFAALWYGRKALAPV